MSTETTNNENMLSNIFSNFFDDSNDQIEDDNESIDSAIKYSQEASENQQTEKTTTPQPNTKTTSDSKKPEEDPLFPEKHYEKEAKKRYGDDVDPNLAEQMEKDEGFKKAMEKTAAHEGGYYNGKNDPGGETNHGISKKAYPNEDIKNMSKDRAEYLYYRDYYKNNNVDKLPDSVRDEVFDNSVNQGSTQAAKNLQRSVGAEPDGIIGPKTIDAVNNTDPEELKEKFKQNVGGVYESIKTSNPANYNSHKNGWDNRLKTY